MQTIIEAQGLHRRFGDIHAVDGVDLSISTGSVVGLIGPNGAGKTTLLRALLGLTRCEGELSVLGYEPHADRARMMEEVCFIADTAVLPRWMRVRELLDYVSGTHPRFSREQVIALAPDIIIITSMARGAAFESVKKEWEQWPDIPAVRHKRIYLVDSDIFDRASPRLVEALEKMADLIHSQGPGENPP